VYMPIPNRYYEAVWGWSPSLVLRPIADNYFFKPITEKVRQVDWHGGYTGAAGGAPYTPPTPPQGHLDPPRLRARPRRAPGRHLRAAPPGQRLPLAQPLQPGGQRRRVDRPDHGGGRPRRPRLGHRLVQLHRAAQPHPRRLQDRQGGRLRNRPARQDARPDLPDRL